MSVLPGDPNTAGDQADIRLQASLTDVRLKSNLSDYAGELRVTVVLRITDKFSGASRVLAATVEDQPFSFTAQCTPTPDTTVGATCGANTTADAVMPGLIKEGKRAVYKVGEVQVFDGGPDGDAETADNTLFAWQGLFVP
jgi:hypothetical protein